MITGVTLKLAVDDQTVWDDTCEYPGDVPYWWDMEPGMGIDPTQGLLIMDDYKDWLPVEYVEKFLDESNPLG